MDKILLISIFLLPFMATQSHAATDFVIYYNQSANWSSNQVGNGILYIDKKVDLNHNVVLPTSVTITIKNGGEFKNNGYKFFMLGSATNPTSEDPRLIYLEKSKIVSQLVVNQIMLNN